ncbi:MAG: DUF4350 domain-containing protein [Hyphomonas sp.]|uniref:DUF4350 domain-containing protein n=1 Tax=Hyphomonas sp. TaxID=87 RepID=UPI00349FDFA0
MRAPQASSSPFSARVVAVLIGVAAISFGAVLVMAGWAPELRDRNQAGDHPYSTSALGYNGLVRLLEGAGYPVEVSRLESALDSRDWGMMILTLPAYGSLNLLEDSRLQPTTLAVLPKWWGRTDPLNPARQADTRFIEARALNDELSEIYPNAEILRVPPPREVDTPFGAVAIKPDVVLQLIRDPSLETVIGTDGGALLAYDETRSFYILSDPDLLNTFGLAQRENARFALQLVDYLRYDRAEPIFLDATLHGFERSENLLKMMFSVPYIGVTLVALAAVMLLGWAATIRFGPPRTEERAIALGKQALADNSAGLVTMARREARMAPGFLALVRRRLAREIGAPRTLTEAQVSDMFDRLGPDTETGRVFSQMEAELKEPAASRDDLLAKARVLYRWRKEIIRRTRHERI